MATYEKAKEETCQTVEEVAEQYHTALADAEVSYDLMLAYATRDKNGDPRGAAVKVRGRACAAKVRICGESERAAGRADAEITLDGDSLDTWSDEYLRAVLDHELTHLDLVINAKTGELVRDNQDRPKLRLLHHDIEFGWFDVVARRHGDNSPEVRQAKQLLYDYNFRQLYLPGLELDEALGTAEAAEAAEAAA